MHKSFKNYRETREILDFGQKYEHLCRTIVRSGVPFDEFWENHGLPYFLSGGATTEEELMEGWNPASWDWKGLANNPTVKAAGQLGRSALSGIGQGLGAAAKTAGGAIAGAGIGAGIGFGQSKMGKNIGGFFNPQQPQPQPQQADPNAPQPQQPQQADPNAPQPQQPQQADPSQAPQQPPLNQNQQQAANTAMASIKKELNTAMTNIMNNSKDPTTQKLAKQFVAKINKYMDTIKIKSGDQAAPTAGTSMPQTTPMGQPAPQST